MSCGQVCLLNIICKQELTKETSKFKMEKVLEKPGFEPILEKIFKLSDAPTLMSCLFVNKYWNNVVQNPTFWLNKLKWAKMPEEILQKWKELSNKLQDNIDLSQILTKCMIGFFEKRQDLGFLSPEMAATALGFVPILEFMATYTKIDFCKVEKSSKHNLSGIQHAIWSGKVEMVKYLHDLGYDLNIPIDEHWTPFLFAVWYSPEVVKFLASVLKNPLSRLWNGRTAFHMAAEFGHHESLKCLLEIKNDPDVKMFGKGATPLQMAVGKGHLECVKVLTSHGASTDCKRYDGYTPIHIAAKQGHLKIVEHLTSIMENVNQPIQITSNLIDNKNNYTALQLAVENGHAEVVEVLAKFVENPNQELPFPNLPYTTPFKIALRKNDSKMVKVLLKVLYEKMDSNAQEIMNSLQRHG